MVRSAHRITLSRIWGTATCPLVQYKPGTFCRPDLVKFLQERDRYEKEKQDTGEDVKLEVKAVKGSFDDSGDISEHSERV